LLPLTQRLPPFAQRRGQNIFLRRFPKTQKAPPLVQTRPGSGFYASTFGKQKQSNMPKYVIERSLTGSDKFSAEKLREIAQQSCDAIISMGPQIQWVQSFVAANKWYCVYIAQDKEAVREHARRGGFPVDAVNEVFAIVDPVDAETKVLSN
jgi:hypothetical protein